MSKSSIWPIDSTLSGAPTLGLREVGSHSNEDVFHILKSSRTAALTSDGLMSYPGHSLERGLTVEMQTVYFTAPADKVKEILFLRFNI